MHTASNPFPNRVSPYPRDLRDSGSNLAGAGKLYPVDPKAHTHLRQCLQQQASAAATKEAAMSQSNTSPNKSIRLTDPDAKEKLTKLLGERRALDNYSYTEELEAAIKQTETAVFGPDQNGKGATKMQQDQNQPIQTRTAVPSLNRTVTKPINPTEIYPVNVVKAAKIEAAKNGRRNLRNVLTDEVLAIWHQWNTSDGKSLDWIAEHNGLLELNGSQVSKYLRKYREGLDSVPATKTGTAISPPLQLIKEPIEELPAETETAVYPTPSEPQPEPDLVEETAVPDADPLPKPETEPMPTAVEPFKAERPENLPDFFNREYQPQPRPGDALAALAALVNDQTLRVKGSVEMNLRIEFGE